MSIMEKMQHKYALSEQGTKDMVKAFGACTLANLAQMRRQLGLELVHAINNKNIDKAQSRRNQIMNEIDNLQNEAQSVMQDSQSDAKLRDINEKLEKLLEEIKKLS